ncbi:unnamed protein product [Prunus armeniaca]
MMFPKFWTQSDIDWSVKLDDSGSYEVRSEMEWLVYCIVLSIGFHSKHTKLLLPPYYGVPQVLDSFRYRLVREIGRFRFVRSSFSKGVVGALHSFIHWISLKTHGMTPTTIVRMKFVLKWSGCSIAQFYPLDFTQNTPNDSSHHIMMFPKFWTHSDIDWSVKLDDSGSYEVRTKFVLKWSGWRIAQFYPLDFTQNTPNNSTQHIMMIPKFWTQSDIDWSVKLDDSGSYEVRSRREWLVHCIVLSIGFQSRLTERLLPPYYDAPQVLDSIRYRLVREIGRFRFV